MDTKEKTPISLIKMASTYNMVIPQKVENKIRHICNKVWDVEWSGTLFYKYSGSFENKDLVITCEDIYVMDIGTSAYTEFDMSPDVIGYMAENPELLDCQIGLIHSHNHLTTFFSGTDTATLKAEGIDRNHFVSLIVNNRGDYTAAITRRVSVEQSVIEKASYNTFEDKEVNTSEEYTTSSVDVEYYMLNISIEGRNNIIDERLAEIKKSKPVATTSITQYKKPTDTTSTKTNFHYGNTYKKTYTAPTTQQKLPFESSFDEPVFIDYDFIDNKVPTVDSYKEVSFDKYAIKSLLIQLITGSIVIEADADFNLEKWVKNMTVVFDKRFGRTYSDLKSFTSWATSYIDYLCYYTEDPSLEELGISEDIKAAICARDLVKELSKLPSNEYIKIYIECLNQICND